MIGRRLKRARETLGGYKFMGAAEESNQNLLMHKKITRIGRKCHKAENSEEKDTHINECLSEFNDETGGNARSLARWYTLRQQ